MIIYFALLSTFNLEWRGVERASEKAGHAIAIS